MTRGSQVRRKKDFQFLLPPGEGNLWIGGTALALSCRPERITGKQEIGGTRLKTVDRVEDHLRSGTNAQVPGQIHPADHSATVHEKFSRPRDVFAVFSTARVQHSVFADHLRVSIREEWEAVSPGFAEPL